MNSVSLLPHLVNVENSVNLPHNLHNIPVFYFMPSSKYKLLIASI